MDDDGDAATDTDKVPADVDVRTGALDAVRGDDE
jgi:hypothetical protein